MAQFKFTKSEFSSTGTADWNYETVGVFKKIPAMKGKKVTFTKKNLKGLSRVTLQIFPKKYDTLADAIADDAVEKLSCTKPLSETVRKTLEKGASQKKMLQWLLSLEIQQNIDNPELYFLFSEKGDGEPLEAFEIDELAKGTIAYEDLAGF